MPIISKLFNQQIVSALATTYLGRLNASEALYRAIVALGTLVVRDSEANILDPGRSSSVTLYREHKLSSDNRSRHPAAFSSRSNSYMLLLSVKNFTWKRSEDMELFISVYTTGGRDGNAESRF